MITLTSETFETEVLQAEGKVLVDFFATWCGPCKMLSPVLAGLEDQYAGTVKFTKIDTDAAMAIAMNYGIEAIPAVLLFEKGAEVRRFVGYRTASEVEEFLK